MRRAACPCGAVVAEVTGEPVRVAVCHCLDCQRRTGSAFSVNARFARDRVAVTGQTRSWGRIGDEGSRLTYHFCPACGGLVWYENSESPGWCAVPVGAFADPGFPAPGFEIYDSRRHDWVCVDLAGP